MSRAPNPWYPWRFGRDLPGILVGWLEAEWQYMCEHPGALDRFERRLLERGAEPLIVPVRETAAAARDRAMHRRSGGRH